MSVLDGIKASLHDEVSLVDGLQHLGPVRTIHDPMVCKPCLAWSMWGASTALAYAVALSTQMVELRLFRGPRCYSFALSLDVSRHRVSGLVFFSDIVSPAAPPARCVAMRPGRIERGHAVWRQVGGSGILLLGMFVHNNDVPLLCVPSPSDL